MAALVASGVDVEELEEAVAAKVAAVDKVKLVLLLNGWHDVEVAIDGGDVIGPRERLGPYRRTRPGRARRVRDHDADGRR